MAHLAAAIAHIIIEYLIQSKIFCCRELRYWHPRAAVRRRYNLLAPAIPFREQMPSCTAVQTPQYRSFC